MSDRVGLQQLLEHDRVGHVLAGGHQNRPHAPADRGRAKDVERRGGLFHPGGPEQRVVHPADRGRHVPDLVRVDGPAGLLAHRLAGDRAPGACSSASTAPTLIFTWVKPQAIASAHSAASCQSE